MKAALSAMTVKTDRKDARGLAQLLRMGWFRPVHAKSIGSREIRALLVARKQLLGRLGSLCGLRSDIATCPKSAKRRRTLLIDRLLAST